MSDAKPRLGAQIRFLAKIAKNGELAADEMPQSTAFLAAARDDPGISERDRIAATKALAVLLKISMEAAQTVLAAERADEGKAAGITEIRVTYEATPGARDDGD